METLVYSYFVLIESKESKVNPKDVGILQYLGFDDWKWAMPMSMMFGFPMIAHEVRAPWTVAYGPSNNHYFIWLS